MKRLMRADHEQVLALPPRLDEWIPPEHPVRFVRDFVASLDLASLGIRQPRSSQGGPAYDPALMVGVWLFGWMERIRSSRPLAKACLRDVAFILLTGNRQPNDSSLRRFFRENREAMRSLFQQTVRVSVKAGLVGFAVHAIDGTKMGSASSFDSALHRKALEDKLQRLDKITDEQLAEMERVEQLQEASYAMPAEMADPQTRRERLRALLEEEKKTTAAERP